MAVRSSLFGTVKRSRMVDGFLVSDALYPPGLTIPWHDHERASLCLIVEGTYDERYGRKHRECQPGMLIVHPADERHADNHHRAPVRLFNIEIATNRLNAIADHTRALAESIDSRSPVFARLGQQLEREFLQTDSASNLAIEALALEFITSASRVDPVRSERPAWLRNAVEMIEANPGAAFTLTSLAENSGVHPVSFARTFRRHYGCNVGTFVRRLRIELACRQLASEPSSLSVIAQRAGFADQSHFSRTFRTLIGVSPGSYRREQARKARLWRF